MLSVWSWLRCDVVVQRLWTLWSSGWERSSSKFPTSKTLNGTMINISTDIFVWKKGSGSHSHSSSSPLVCFNHIKEGFVIYVSSGEPQADFSHLQQPFDTPAFNKLYRGQTPFVIMMIIKVVLVGFFFCILYTCSRVSPESDLIKPSYWTCWYINVFVAVVPVRKVHALTISWAVPPQGKHYRWVQHSFIHMYRCRGWLDLLMNQ